jgi:hypothetical protein
MNENLVSIEIFESDVEFIHLELNSFGEIDLDGYIKDGSDDDPSSDTHLITPAARGSYVIFKKNQRSNELGQ